LRASGPQYHGRISTYSELDAILWESILEDFKVLGILGSWLVWVHEKL
jgi:hypothetical protein